jgi:type VI protein secretion system component VasF
MEVILKRAKIFALELLNLLTDLLVPVMDIVVLVATVLPVPTKVVASLHKFEEMLKDAGAKVEDFKL